MARKGHVNRTMKQKLHAQTRAKERLGVELSHRQLKQLSTRVRAGRFLCHRDGNEIWRIDVAGQVCDVIFDPEREHIVSFLPLKTVGREQEKARPR